MSIGEARTMVNEFPVSIENMSDEELAFRGWTREGIRKRWADRVEADKRSPQVGESAPDFELELLSVAGIRTGSFLKLSSLKDKPVGLIFGSYT